MYHHHTPEYRRWYENAINQINRFSNNQLECVKFVNEVCNDRKRKITAAADFILSMDDTRSYREKSYWESPICKLRKLHRFYHAVMPALRLENLGYENYFRMSAVQLEELMKLVGPRLVKQYWIREPIIAGERLVSTLRFLASGDSIHSMHYQYLFSTTTASKIFSETSFAIWEALQPKVLPDKLNEQDWLQIAHDYEEKWNFPNCIGSIDGKHVHIQCPDNAGSMFFNYKNFHSIVLLAICDANYIFRFVDVGAYGRRSDGGIFSSSVIGRKFEAGKMNVPAPSFISNTRPTPLPYCLVGGEAFPLKSYLMRPYPGKCSVELHKRVFNYRLSRARKIIENSFGILANRWRIFRNPLIGSQRNVIRYIQAALCLHNWLRIDDMQKNSENSYLDEAVHQRQQSKSNQVSMTPGAFTDLTRIGCNNRTYEAEQIREEFSSYFNNEGALSWQYEYI